MDGTKACCWIAREYGLGQHPRCNTCPKYARKISSARTAARTASSWVYTRSTRSIKQN